MKSAFTDKNNVPTTEELNKALGVTFRYWQQIQLFTKEICPKATEAWHFSGEKYGWGFRISDKKRVLVYLLPRNGFFKTAFVFGKKAAETILESNISAVIRQQLAESKVYAEGRGIRIDVRDDSQLTDIQQLVKIKISN